jgi:hypothetical protein
MRDDRLEVDQERAICSFRLTTLWPATRYAERSEVGAQGREAAKVESLSSATIAANSLSFDLRMLVISGART